MMNNLLKKSVVFRVIAASTAVSMFIKLFVTFNNTNRSEKKSIALNGKQDKLVSVQMLHRHGARTPLHLIPGIEEVRFRQFQSIDLYKIEFSFFSRLS
jgi:hypothetical protein